MAGRRGPRLLPRLQRHAAPPRRVRAARLRCAPRVAQPLDHRRPGHLLRRTAARARRPGPSAGLSGRGFEAHRAGTERSSSPRAVTHGGGARRRQAVEAGPRARLGGERRRGGTAARRAPPIGDQRREEPGRRDAAGLSALFGHGRVYRPAVPRSGERGRGQRSERVAGRRARYDRRAGLQGTARLVRAPVHGRAPLAVGRGGGAQGRAAGAQGHLGECAAHAGAATATSPGAAQARRGARAGAGLGSGSGSGCARRAGASAYASPSRRSANRGG